MTYAYFVTYISSICDWAHILKLVLVAKATFFILFPLPALPRGTMNRKGKNFHFEKPGG